MTFRKFFEDLNIRRYIDLDEIIEDSEWYDLDLEIKGHKDIQDIAEALGIWEYVHSYRLDQIVLKRLQAFGLVIDNDERYYEILQ